MNCPSCQSEAVMTLQVELTLQPHIARHRRVCLNCRALWTAYDFHERDLFPRLGASPFEWGLTWPGEIAA